MQVHKEQREGSSKVETRRASRRPRVRSCTSCRVLLGAECDHAVQTAAASHHGPQVGTLSRGPYLRQLSTKEEALSLLPKTKPWEACGMGRSGHCSQQLVKSLGLHKVKILHARLPSLSTPTTADGEHTPSLHIPHQAHKESGVVDCLHPFSQT